MARWRAWCQRWALQKAAWQQGICRYRGQVIVVVLATIIGQLALWYHRANFFDTFYDSSNYLTVAHHMAFNGRFFDALRTPVYPGYLALFYLLHVPVPTNWAIGGQILMMLAVIGQVIWLAHQLGASPWGTALIGAAVASNPYIMQWERAVNTEGPAMWLLTTGWVLVVLYLREQRPARILALAALLVILLLTRPFYLYLPLLLVGGLLWWIWRQRLGRTLLAPLVLASLLVCGMLGAYMVANKAATGYLGLSSASNINLFGKVLVNDAPGAMPDPRYARLNLEIAMYKTDFPQTAGFVDPWPFLFDLHPGYLVNGSQVPARYSQEQIARHPRTFGALLVRDSIAAWLALPVLYGGSLAISWQSTLLIPSALAYGGYLLVPLLVILWCGYVLRRPWDRAALVVALLSCSLIGAVIMAGGFSYDPREFARLRAPLDWAMVLLVGLSLDHALRWLGGLRLRGQRRLRALSVAHKGQGIA